MTSALRRTPLWLRLLPVVTVLGIASCASPKAEVVDTRPQVLYLHTEFLPYEQGSDKDLSNRLSREIARQALLVAARDGLGVQTCDETLQETPPDDAHVVHLMLTERCSRDGKWHLTLSKFAEEKETDASKPIWEKTYNCDVATTKIYADTVPKLEADSRGELIEALKTAGLHPEKHTPGSAPKEQASPKEQSEKKEQKEQVAKEGEKDAKPGSPPDKIRQLLLTPDFVSQFGAVRAAHQAIQAGGETPEWLSVLARGYANLATLTHNHWSSSTEVFTARAWLYGQRMAATKADDSFALANRAYAWALGGCFQNALADIERIDKLPAAPAAAANKDTPPDEGQWLKLTRAFVSCDRGETWLVGKDNKDLKPWAAYLQFELANFARYPEWMYQAANEVGPVCPTAYKTFDELAHHGQQLGVVRMGATTAPSAFAHFLPLTLANLPDLPAEISALVPADKAKQAEVLKQANDPEPKDGFSPLPGFLAEKLRERSRQKLEGDLSWSALATLLEEEQFVEVANFMVVATNATETPLQSLVDSVLPLVKKHRFASYVESFTLGGVRDPGRLFELFGKMPVHDPRMNMSPMFARIGYLKDSHGAIGPRLMEEAGRNFTLPDIVEFISSVGAVGVQAELMLGYANEARAIAPSSPLGTRLLVLVTQSPTSGELIAWERTAADDSTTLLALARQHVKLDEKVAAVRCWEKSIAALPSVTSVTELAAFHRKEGDLKKWEETLTDFLQKPDLGLQHSVVQTELALGFANLGDWKKAKPYAVAAAETYSCRGLGVGSYIAEGLGEWELSEQLIKAESTSYPTGNGAEWYFWCRRTGRGDVKSAAQLAAQYFALPQPHPNESTFVVRGMYDLLRGNQQSARDDFQQALNIKRTFTYTCLAAQLSRELKDEPALTEVIAAMEKDIEDPANNANRPPDVIAAGKLLLDLVKNRNPSPERVAAIEEALLKIDDVHRNSAVGWCYFIGTELEAAGNKKEAEKYWRRALIDSNRDQIIAALAGVKLAKLRGKSRPDDDPLAAKDLWPPLKAK